MTLKNFSDYNFSFRGNALIVRNNKTKHIAKRVCDRFHQYGKYYLRDDNGNKVSVTELRLAYCLINHCSLSDIKGKKVSGSVDAPILAKTAIYQVSPADEKYKRLADFEYAFEVLKRVYITSDYSSLILFAQQSKSTAIKAIHDLCGFNFNKLMNCYDDAVERFIAICTNAAFTAIKPLFGLLCKCLKEEYLLRIQQTKSFNNKKLDDYYD